MEGETTDQTNQDTFQPLPGKTWLSILLSLVCESQDLRSLKTLSLICRALREATLPLLYTSCTFTLGGFGPVVSSNPNLRTSFTWFSPSEQIEATTLEQLRFITSPRIAKFVKRVQLRCLEVQYMHSVHQGIASGLIDEVFLSLHHLTSLKELALASLPISIHHLQALCHRTFSNTLISLMRCMPMDPQIGETAMTYSAVHIQGSLDFSSGPIVKSVLTQSLTELTISEWEQRAVIEEILESGVRFEELKVLAVDKQMLALLMQYPQLFPNILRLSVPDRVYFLIEGVNFGSPGTISDSALTKLEILDCPLELLPQFSGRQVRELTLSSSNRSTTVAVDSRDLDRKVRLVINQSEQLLSNLSTLKILHVMDIGSLLEEFLARCQGLRSCQLHFSRTSRSFRRSNGMRPTPMIELARFLDQFREMTWPSELEDIEVKPPITWRTNHLNADGMDQRMLGPLLLAALNSAAHLPFSLRKIKFVISLTKTHRAPHGRFAHHKFLHILQENGIRNWQSYEAYVEG